MGLKPRFDPYCKLLGRFYEPLILLHALGKTRGAHTPGPQDANTDEFRRRRLLRNLSYLCDYEKGGDTTSSIGLEENEQRFVFWVASNATRAHGKIKAFLKSVLEKVRLIIDTDEDQRGSQERDLIRMCILFAQGRVKKEIKLASRYVGGRIQRLNNDNQVADTQLLTLWLSQFVAKKATSVADICFLAYDQRNAPEMRQLEIIIRADYGGVHTNSYISDLKLARHYLGRLAHHVRAPKEVIEDLSGLYHLLETYDVCLVKPIPCNVRPQADSLTELLSIAKRMLPANDPRLKEYEDCLVSLDQKFDIGIKIQKKYGDSNFQPVIHAEIQVLEHFYTKQLSFANRDRYIGCSKPACYCCHLYFRHHPSRPVEPRSHQILYLNWGMAALPMGTNDPDYKQQRDLINKMVETIRKDALDQITRKAGPLNWHADSTTGITKSFASESSSERGSTLSTDSDIQEDTEDDTSSISGLHDGNIRQPESDSDSDSTSDSDPNSDSDSDGGVVLSWSCSD